MIKGHGGNIYCMARAVGCKPEDFIDMSSNTNPIGVMPGLVDYVRDNINAINIHPEVDSRGLVESFANYYHIDADCVLAGNGTTQFIFSAPLALASKNALIIGPTYTDYEDSCKMHNIDFKYVMTSEVELYEANLFILRGYLDETDTVFLCNPNNPTGSLITRTDLIRVCTEYPDVYFIIDESYLPFAAHYEEDSMVNCGLANVLVLHSFSKIFKIPGLRLGFLVAPKDIIEKFASYYEPWSVNGLAQAAGYYIMEDEEKASSFLRDTQSFVEKEGYLFIKRLEGVSGVRVFPSNAPFFLVKIERGVNAGRLCSDMAHERILLRDCSNFKGLSDQFVRVSLRGSRENAMLVEKLRGIFG